MNNKHKQTGVITQISEIQEFPNGAKKLSYLIDTKEQYDNLLKFEMYKPQAYVSFVENFSTQFKIGDTVEVEFVIRSSTYKDKIFNSLGHWGIHKSESNTPNVKGDDLPF